MLLENKNKITEKIDNIKSFKEHEYIIVKIIYFIVLVSTFLPNVGLLLYYFPLLYLFKVFFLLNRLYLLIIIFNISNTTASQLLINRNKQLETKNLIF